MGCVLPKKDFIPQLRKLCSKNGAVLIFDEVMTGFRLGLGGAQEILGVDADLITYGKVIGGGLPVGAFGGKKEIMDFLGWGRGIKWSPYRRALMLHPNIFDVMDSDDRKVAKVPKIQVVRAEEGTTMASLAEQSPITNYALDKLRVMNGLYPNGEPEPGQLIKIVD